MNREERIKKEIEKTLQSLDHVERAETGDFFYTRLHTRLEQRKEEGVQQRKQLSVAFAAALVVLLVNIVSVITYLQVNSEESEARHYYLEEMYNEYGLSATTFYETNTNQP